MSSSTVTVAAAPPRGSPSSQPCFTVSQWQELEHQALIFKYLKAGLSVPPYLLLPIRKSFNLFSPSFFPTPTCNLSYYPYYGKKIDNEPGRCRRTDGKKWRCSKDAHPDSKYCDRHMNRSRNRSRKPVESKATAQLSMSSVASSHIATGSSSRTISFPNLSLPSPGNPEASCFGSNMARWQMESMPYDVALGSKEYRSLHGPKPETDKQTFVQEAYGSARNLGLNNSTSDDAWHQIPSNRLSESRSDPLLQNHSSQLQTLQDFEPLSIGGAMSRQQQQQHYVFGREIGSGGPMKQDYEEYQPLQPLFDEWPRCKDLDSYLIDQRSSENSSGIQLSMAIPMASNSAVKSFHSQDDVCREN